MTEPWWQRAVFYRLDPARYQDSDGDGRGDLRGVSQRLDYLQSLGVDALLLDGKMEAGDLDALGDLIREASRHQLRVLVTAEPDAVKGPREAVLIAVRGWLGAGAAGVWVPKATDAKLADAGYAALIGSLRGLVQSFPGERVLITDPAPMSLSPAPRPVRVHRRINPGSFQPARGGQLVTTAPLPVSPPEAAHLRASLGAAGEETFPTTNGLLRFVQPPATNAPDLVGDAASLLGSRGAVVLDFGEEIGLNMYPAPALGPAGTYAALPVMQWTPSNETAAQKQEEVASPAAMSEPEFGAYHPYLPPPRGIGGPASGTAKVTADLNVPETLPEPNTLPGFTRGALPAAPVEGATRNVTTQDRDPKSLLNAYRQLIALHHSNPTLRNGTQYVLNRDSQNALIWVRRAPAGSRTAANVVGAVNLSDHPVTLAIDDDLAGFGMRPGALRPLFSSAPQATTGETTGRLIVPPHAVLLGEIYHAGSLGEPASRARHSGRRSGRRVRR